MEHPYKKNHAYGQLLLADSLAVCVIHRREEVTCVAWRTSSVPWKRVRSVGVGCHAACTSQSRRPTIWPNGFRENADSYFRFITEPNVEPTNNLAEQAIRFVADPPVASRKVLAVKTAAVGANASGR